MFNPNCLEEITKQILKKAKGSSKVDIKQALDELKEFRKNIKKKLKLE